MNAEFLKINLQNLTPQVIHDWQAHGSEGRRGASIRVLFEQRQPYFKAALVRFHPGSAAAAHDHTGIEYIYVIDGQFEDELGR